MAAQFRELQDKLEQLAADYFVAIDSVEATNEETEREIAKLRERAEQQTRKARDDAEQVIARMIDAGASPAEVAARLGITTREVKKATRATPSSAPSAIGSSAAAVQDEDERREDYAPSEA
ncbi:hypothetical protein AES38_15405 (plasmid) [Clavibacter capsici]|nr:hypothetical protein AES38_15405 [Clavibacter capsici]